MNFIKVLVLIIVMPVLANAQESYWVFFNDKNVENFDPYEFFDQKAIERRQNFNIDLYDYSDIPVNTKYIELVSKFSTEVCNTSRWLNAVFIETTAENIQIIKSLSCVDSIVREEGEMYITSCESPIPNLYSDDDPKYLVDKIELINQTEIMGASYFNENEINGEGVRICVLDMGFYGTDDQPALKHLFRKNRIIDTYNPLQKRKNVYRYSDHGTSVLSCVAGIYDSINIGFAPEAEFLLASVAMKNNNPTKRGLSRWIEALEWADQNGADVVTSSVIVSSNLYDVTDLNGQHFVSLAASMAADKGIVLLNAAGNEGNDAWTVIQVPADAENIITVGALDNYNYAPAYFTSVGPTYDGRIKPNVSAIGETWCANGKLYDSYYTDTVMVEIKGTSFATPLVAGFAACVRQLHPEYTAYQVIEEIEKSAHLYPYFDYANGYGVPQASYFIKDSTAIDNDSIENKATFRFEEDSTELMIYVDYVCKPNYFNGRWHGYYDWYKYYDGSEREIYFDFDSALRALDFVYDANNNFYLVNANDSLIPVYDTLLIERYKALKSNDTSYNYISMVDSIANKSSKSGYDIYLDELYDDIERATGYHFSNDYTKDDDKDDKIDDNNAQCVACNLLEPLLYYKITDVTTGLIEKYKVIKMKNHNYVLRIDKEDLEDDKKISVFYMGYINEYELPKSEKNEE